MLSATDSQLRVLHWLRYLTQKLGAPPTIRELTTALEFASVNSTVHFLDALHRKGYARKVRGGVSRGWRITRKGTAELRARGLIP